MGAGGWGTITVKTTQNPALRIQSDTFSRFFPEFTELWSPYNQTLQLESLDLQEVEESHTFAWDLLFEHIHAFEMRRSSTYLVDTLEQWQSQLGPWVEQSLTDPQGVPHIIAALGDLLSPECLGCNSSLFGQVLMFLSRTLPRSMTYDPYIAAATLCCLCEIARDEPAWLQRTYMAIRSVDAADEFVNWIATDPSCQYFFPISEDLHSILQLITPVVDQPGLLPPSSYARKPHRAQRRQQLGLGQHHQVFQPLIGPSSAAMQRTLIAMPQKTIPAIRGSFLPPSRPVKTAWRHPDQVQMNISPLFNHARPASYPQYCGYPSVMPPIYGGI